MTKEQMDFISKCQLFLKEKWDQLQVKSEAGTFKDPLGKDHFLVPLIRDCLTSNVKTYHYVLPTQILAKSVAYNLDCHSLQVAHDVPGAFDARTIAHKVIVPFDQANHRVLGGSLEPYVNNPVRVPAVTAEYRDQQKNKQDWDKLVKVLDTIEGNVDRSFTEKVFEQVLFEISQLLTSVQIAYPSPNRISLDKANSIINEYLSTSSGGDRMEVICTALFQTIGEKFKIFDSIRREKVNVPDTSSGMLADIECYLEDQVVLIVEVKDWSITLAQLNNKLDHVRAKHIAEILFLARTGKNQAESEEIDKRILSEFSSGHNIYITDFFDFVLGIFILLGEEGRINFIDKIGKELDRGHSEYTHRKAWADLLKQA